MEQPQGIIKSTRLNLKRGKRFGKYQLSKRLGEGGYCEVWKARDTIEGISVALKIPRVELDGKRDNQTIMREVRLVSRLRHRHIVPVKNAEIIDGHAVLITELSSGTLEDCSRPMSVKRIISIITKVLDGLECAHRHRIVHCDVTPGNIFLFPGGRAAIGDFGIGLHLKGRAKTIDEYGTPGYVAPEQAYGRPTYRSDCFAVGIILYEFITGVLPRWPYKWPFRGYDRLRDKTNAEFVKFIKKAISVDPATRFADARQMLAALIQATPQKVAKSLKADKNKLQKQLWKQVRRHAFLARYSKVLTDLHLCKDCGEPISESMLICPWCRSEKNQFSELTRFSHFCPRCKKGMSPEWHYCPWCYGPGFEPQPDDKKYTIKYQSNCEHCHGKISRFMRYCPWCHRKIKKPWRVYQFPEFCSKCGWSVDSNFWNSCPWCQQRLI